MNTSMSQKKITIRPASSGREGEMRTPRRIRRDRNILIRSPDELMAGAPPKARPVKRNSVVIAPKSPEVKKLRVAAYCRVSTDNLEQQTSIFSQRKHYEDYISRNPGWELAGIYWETGVTGTRADARPQLQQLLTDCRKGRVDLVLTKSISRFARNTEDCLKMVRLLIGLGVNIIFEKEQIDTRSMESEFLLTLFSSIAEEESRSIASNSQWAVQKRFRSGTFRYSKAPFGYELANGSFVVNPVEAEIVRGIFQDILSGKGTMTIAAGLNERNIPTGTRRRDGSDGVWTAYMVGGIVKNISYTGDILMQKTWTDSSFKRRTNRGQRRQYYMDHHHEAIIDHDTYEKANAALTQRGKEKGIRSDSICGTNRYAFSEKLSCGCCGGQLRRITVSQSGRKEYYWGCSEHIRDKTHCSMKKEQEETLQNAFVTMLNKLAFSSAANHYIRLLLREDNAEAARFEGIRQKEKLIEEKKNNLMRILRNGCGKPVSYREMICFLETEEQELHLLKSELPKIPEAMILKQIVEDWKYKRSEYFPEDLFTEIVKSGTVTTGKEIIFHLYCGLDLTETLERGEI